MSLGVLNNINAIYAQNNLNNTSNSLSKVLQQLSSGSKISSGSDDAAGLSLVNGLQANSQALSQSKTNASEGVGLLSVADGALSQVTNLLNRAVTLATEAANGTLNTAQDTAANQEYQSILSEISNIGSTTTYNNQSVFGTTTNIFTGDSSSTGASINSLNIRSLSSSNVGDTNGTMAYSSGTNNVFIDLSSSGKNAAVSDTLGTASQTTTITVNYLTQGAGGAAVNAQANISVGAGTSFSNTAQGLISAINASGLGITAAFGTAAQAGSAATAAAVSANATNNALLTGGTDTGIIISGAGVAVNNNSAATGFSNGAGEVGTLTVNQASDSLSGTLNVVDSAGKAHAITLGTANSTDTLANLASTINAAGYGITATVNGSSTTNASGTHAAGTLLSLTSASSATSVVTTSATNAAASASSVGGSFATGTNAGDVLGVITVAKSTDTLSGVLALTNDHAGPVVQNLLLGTAGSTDTLANLAATINAGNGAGGIYQNIQATVTNGTTLTLTQLGAKVSGGPVAAIATGSQIQDHAATTGTAVVAQNATLATATAANTTFGTITLTNANDSFTGGTLHIADVNTPAGTAITLGQVGSTDTLANLANYINVTLDSGSATSKISATVSTDGTQLLLKNTTSAAGSASDMVYSTGVTTSLSLTGTPTAAGTASATTMGTLSLAVGSTSATTLTGTLSLGTETITLGTAATTTFPGTSTMTQLAQTINTGNYGVSATLNQAGTAIVLTSANSNAGSQAVAGTDNISPTLAGSNVGWGTQNAGQITSAFYSIGISGVVQDTSTGANTTTALTKGNSSDQNGSGGVATITYSDSAGTSLSNTNLLTQTNAQATLTALNQAITNVAAQDGYIGAQINTLNSVSQVLATQSENVTSAQNAVQATDYASATSNMSKYQILSQTGISALAQANSMQQEVTKLLQ